MKIIITGAGGQLGRDCTKVFAGKNEVLAFDSSQMDISNHKHVDSVITAEKPDVIINCAAFTAVDACETERELAGKINADGPAYLARAAEKTGSRLVHISTDYVFSGSKPIPEYYIEEDETGPLSQYGITKLAGERAVLKYCGNSLCLRTAWLYSGYGKNFLKTILKMALSDPQKDFTIVDDQYGSLTWSYTLARQIARLLDSDLIGIVHATAEGYSSWYEAACYFLNAMQLPHNFKPCKTEDYPTPAHRPANSNLENGVLKREGLSLFVDWREDLDSFAAEFGQQLAAEAGNALTC
ncbi:MAG: dTDP-4-dehydrorhamnose reductase [Deltaproteobacteria bacterium]|nr:MAG: dTDP-4-dehydrorhamnose reductase [Deltaproteobacteria bacterium]